MTPRPSARLRGGLVNMTPAEFDSLAAEVERPGILIPAWRVRSLVQEIEAQSVSRAAILDTYVLKRGRPRPLRMGT